MLDVNAEPNSDEKHGSKLTVLMVQSRKVVLWILLDGSLLCPLDSAILALVPRPYCQRVSPQDIESFYKSSFYGQKASYCPAGWHIGNGFFDTECYC